MFKKDEKYKIEFANLTYVGVIMSENDTHIIITDKFGKEVGLLKSEIKLFKLIDEDTKQ